MASTRTARRKNAIAIYSFTLAWIFTFLQHWRRTRRTIEWMTAITMVLEIGIIGMQAGRGTTSHFNVGTPLDATLFSIMGIAIVVQTLSSIAVAVALWRQQFKDHALGWALRLGLTITIVGATTGGLMLGPTRQQLEDARAGHRMTIVGAHTVGAPDGSPGIPGTGWSTEHGDLRVPHFVGLHAMQALPTLRHIARATTRQRWRAHAAHLDCCVQLRRVLCVLADASAHRPTARSHTRVRRRHVTRPTVSIANGVATLVAFDLLMGTWEARDSIERKVSRLPIPFCDVSRLIAAIATRTPRPSALHRRDRRTSTEASCPTSDGTKSNTAAAPLNTR